MHAAVDAEPGRLEFDLEVAPALEVLLLRVPCSNFGTELGQLLPGKDARHLKAARKLYCAGVLVAC